MIFNLTKLLYHYHILFLHKVLIVGDDLLSNYVINRDARSDDIRVRRGQIIIQPNLKTCFVYFSTHIILQLRTINNIQDTFPHGLNPGDFLNIVNCSKYWWIVSIGVYSSCIRFCKYAGGVAGTTDPKKPCKNSLINSQHIAGTTHGLYSTSTKIPLKF
jgi:hypothetical protein